MADSTTIEWTDSTWNPVTGCTKVSPGCDNCYAATFAERWRGTAGHHFENGFDITLRPERLRLPMTWRTPRRIFLDSMSDLFHTDIPDDYIAQVFAVMALTPQHTYQVLTKRHGRMKALLSRPSFWHLVADQGREHFTGCQEDWLAVGAMLGGDPLPNVWLGVSVEDQKWADLRIPALLETPAVVRFLSCEPLVGPVDLKQAVIPMGSERGHGLTASYVHAGGCCQRRFHGIDWVIVGGESGPGARPMHPQWARSLRDQCEWAGVPFFLKQWGAHAPEDQGHDRGAVVLIDTQGHSWNRREALAPKDAVRMRRVGKKDAGRLLDGKHHDAVPAPAR
jgi:protein gp37